MVRALSIPVSRRGPGGRRRRAAGGLASGPDRQPAAGPRHARAAERRAASAGRPDHGPRARGRQRPAGEARAGVRLGGRAPGRTRHADRRQRRVRSHRAAGGPLHADGVEVGFRGALVRPAAAAAGRHAAAARRRSADEGDRVPAAARQRDQRPRARRRRRRDAGRDGARHALPVPAGRAAPDAGRQRPDRRQGSVPRLGPDARRVLRQRDRAGGGGGRSADPAGPADSAAADAADAAADRAAVLVARRIRSRSTTRRPTIPASRR